MPNEEVGYKIEKPHETYNIWFGYFNLLTLWLLHYNITRNDEEIQTHFEFLKINFLLCLRCVSLLGFQQFYSLSEWLVNVEEGEADQNQVRKEDDQDLQLEIQKVRRGHIVRTRLYPIIREEAAILSHVGVTCSILFILWPVTVHYQGEQYYQKRHSLGICKISKLGELDGMFNWINYFLL